MWTMFANGHISFYFERLWGADSLMTSNARTVISFGKYRAAHQPDQPMHPDAARFAGDTDQMAAEDGLESWIDGPIDDRLEEPAERPVFNGKPAGQHLWIVTAHDVLHAPEACIFGQQRGAGLAKHSNLTGGGSAFVGGEVALLDETTIAIAGSSGRYRLRSADESHRDCVRRIRLQCVVYGVQSGRQSPEYVRNRHRS